MLFFAVFVLDPLLFLGALFGAELGLDVAREFAQKAARLTVREGVSVRTALVYDGRLSQTLLASDDIDRLISAKDLLCLRYCDS